MNPALRMLVVALAALCGGCALGACGDDEQESTAVAQAVQAPPAVVISVGQRRVPPATFTSLPSDWRAFGRGAPLTRRGAVASSFAASWAFDPSSPNGPAGELPDGEVLVEVLLLRRFAGGAPSSVLCRGVAPSRAYPPIGRLPLQLEAMERAMLEGSPDVPQYRFLGTQRDRDYRVEVRVSIAPGGSRTAAQQALDGLRLPTWGMRC